jgi:hypothetical protein
VPGDLIVAIEELEHEFWSVKVRTCIDLYISFLKQFLVFRKILKP